MRRNSKHLLLHNRLQNDDLFSLLPKVCPFSLLPLIYSSLLGIPLHVGNAKEAAAQKRTAASYKKKDRTFIQLQ